MLSSRYRPWHVPLFLGKYAWLTLRRRPILVHFEVTERCNARCSFCDYWKTPAAETASSGDELAAAARHFNPMLITFTGGEPTLRRDLEQVVSGIAGSVRLRYMMLLSHGAMLTAERARSLWQAGIDQFNISLDYLDGRHDDARGIPGLTQKILSAVPAMRTYGIGGIRFNTVIRTDNLDQLLPIVSTAAEMGAGVNFSVYTDFKNGNTDGLIARQQLPELQAVIDELLAYKRRRRGVITSSDHYLEQIPRYVRGEVSEPCRSGIRTIHIDPRGMVRRCPDFPSDFHWSDYRAYEPIDCNACFYACRGEAQAPLRLSRVRDVMA